MIRKLRIAVGVLILILSIWLLIWGFAPMRRETRIQNISPSEMQLPSPSSYHFDLASHFDEMQRVTFHPWLEL